MAKAYGPQRFALVLVVLLMLPAARALADPRAEARRHFQEGMSLVAEGKYEEGTRELYEAYRILPHPAVLYNIGRAFFDGGSYGRAIEELERYVATDPPDKDEAERLLEVARERLRQRAADPGDPAASPRSPADHTAAAGGSSGGRGGTVGQELALLRQELKETLERVDTLQGAIRSSPGTARAQRTSASGRLAPAARARAQADA